MALVAENQTAFSFAQLSDDAKEHARDKHREYGLYDDWHEFIFDDAVAIADMLGITIASRAARTMGGSKVNKPEIWFSGFSSQGDGACFEGTWEPDISPEAIIARVTSHAPQDKKLHAIAESFAELSARCELARDVSVSVTHSGRYYHAYSTSIDVDFSAPDNVDQDNELQVMVWESLCKEKGMDYDTFRDDVSEVLRDFMNWIYRQLETEYEYQMSEECIDEYLSAYTFDEDGNFI